MCVCVRVTVITLDVLLKCIMYAYSNEKFCNQQSHLNAHSVEWATAQSPVVRIVTCSLR